MAIDGYKTMSKEFEGVSENGNIEEAINLAIQRAKAGSGPTDHVSWELVGIKGVNGGFILQNQLTVTISAQAVKQ